LALRWLTQRKRRFRTIDFTSIHLSEPPFVPELRSKDDTRYFDDNIDPNPLATPGTAGRAYVTKDPLLRDPELLDIRKELAFKGYTFRYQRRRVIDPRDGLLDVRLEGACEVKGDRQGESHPSWSASRLRARALSL
jgi:hypothetical protein